MKKNFLVTLLLLLFFGSISGWAEATMINYSGNDIVLDDSTGLVWYKNVASFTGLTYEQQLNSISSLSKDYDVNGDGSLDTLTWNIASHLTVNDLISNYQLDNEINRAGMMGLFSNTRFEGNMIQTQEIYGRIGTNTSVGNFKLMQMYDYNIPVTPPGSVWVQDIYLYGETSIVGPSLLNPSSGLIDPFVTMAMPDLGAWANATVEYGNPVPEPSTMLLFGLGCLGLAGVSRKKNSHK